MITLQEILEVVKDQEGVMLNQLHRIHQLGHPLITEINDQGELGEIPTIWDHIKQLKQENNHDRK